MGFINSSSTINLTAKLTPYGRKAFLNDNSNLITHFSLSDEDSNYYVSRSLESGLIPDTSGSLPINNLINNSTSQFYNSSSKLFYNDLGLTKKQINNGINSGVVSELIISDQVTVPFTNLGIIFLNVNDFETDEVVNLTKSLNIPFNDLDRQLFTGVTFSNGGYSDTALSGIANENYMIFSIPLSAYGESIDAKSVNFSLSSSSGTYNIYSSFQKKNISLFDEDYNFNETSKQIKGLGDNIAFLFTDQIKRPNNSLSKSWSTGYGTSKPYSKSKKELFNLLSDTSRSIEADKAVGFINLDKGFVVISEQNIIDDISNGMTSGTSFSNVFRTATPSSTVGLSLNINPNNIINFTPKATPITISDSILINNANIKFKSFSNMVYRQYTCYIGVGEFFRSNNITFNKGDNPRISSVLLLDKDENVIAVSKLDRHLVKTISEDFVLSVKLYL